MTIKLPRGLPVAERLRDEGIAIADEGIRFPRRTLRLALVNLMPRKEASELALRAASRAKRAPHRAHSGHPGALPAAECVGRSHRALLSPLA